MLRDLLVHVDSSESGRRKVRFAVGLAARTGTQLSGIHVAPSAEVPPLYKPSQVDEIAGQLTSRLAREASAAAAIFSTEASQMRRRKLVRGARRCGRRHLSQGEVHGHGHRRPRRTARRCGAESLPDRPCRRRPVRQARPRSIVSLKGCAFGLWASMARTVIAGIRRSSCPTGVRKIPSSDAIERDQLEQRNRVTH